jgi:transposase-like protein
MENEKKMKRKEGKFFSLNTKREAVLDYESKDFTVGEIKKKYNIANYDTLKRWCVQYSTKPSDHIPLIQHSRSTRILAVQEIQFGYMTIQEAAVKYSRRTDVIKHWVKVLSDEIPLKIESDRTLQVNTVQQVMTTSEQNEFKDLQKALKQEQLKVLGLETMIGMAEKNYNIDIRKKFGSK